eukprot:symbB.v1.2.019290.t1/scaffold1574.1/size208356/3
MHQCYNYSISITRRRNRDGGTNSSTLEAEAEALRKENAILKRRLLAMHEAAVATSHSRPNSPRDNEATLGPIATERSKSPFGRRKTALWIGAEDLPLTAPFARHEFGRSIGFSEEDEGDLSEEERTLPHHVTREAAYLLYLFWQLAGGAKQFTEVHGISRAVLVEAVEPRSIAILALRKRIKRLDGEMKDLVSRVEFWAQEGLSCILSVAAEQKKDPKSKPKVEIPVADLKHVFDVLDDDDDGTLSIREMVQQGALEVKDALYLSEVLDKGQDGEVSLSELMNLVTGTGGEVSETLKGLFAARMSA